MVDGDVARQVDQRILRVDDQGERLAGRRRKADRLAGFRDLGGHVETDEMLKKR